MGCARAIPAGTNNCIANNMTTKEILDSVGNFSTSEINSFETYTDRRLLHKGSILLPLNKTCSHVFFILSGSFIQYTPGEETDQVVDLHLQHEWMFNYNSLITQLPSTTVIKAFTKAEVLELSLHHFHTLVAGSTSFLQLNSIFSQVCNRIFLFDNAMDAIEKYNYIKKVKPGITQEFPVKTIASFLKIAPETLSRIRGSYRIS